jgi:monoamine oxidase
VTPSPNRFIIPGGKGIIQISYTDSRDAEPLIALLKEKGERALGEFLVKELAAVLGHPVPPPLFVRAHKWKEAVTYWLPGDYSPQEMSKAACNPLPETLPNLYLCGESYSLRQCWVEGALEHAQQMLGSLLPVIS